MTRGRYENAGERKRNGVVYTPQALAAFVAGRVAGLIGQRRAPVRVLDPAVGDGALLRALLPLIAGPVEVCGFDTDPDALRAAQERLSEAFPDARLRLMNASFVDRPDDGEVWDAIIANPPYVRAQVMGSERASEMSARFGLKGKTDLAHAFTVRIAASLSPEGVAGIIVPNGFMSSRSGAGVREAIVGRVREVWDLGDTKPFDAAVLPAVVVMSGTRADVPARFVSSYVTNEPATSRAACPIGALATPGVCATPDGRSLLVSEGRLENDGDPAGVWRIGSNEADAWLAAVRSRTWATFGDVIRVRVGVKSCADKVFVPKAWDVRPELLRPLTTHHVARRFRPLPVTREALYPHRDENGRAAPIDLEPYPVSRAWLESHRDTLEARGYVAASGRRWYEMWVPQSPAAWSAPKIVFRDIAERPTFWMDRDGTVVNGDCYWMSCEDESLLWLAMGVANSRLAEKFYDSAFNSRIYAGRRRFLAQYVERFPLPDPATPAALRIVEACRDAYRDGPCPAAEARVDEAVASAFFPDG